MAMLARVWLAVTLLLTSADIAFGAWVLWAGDSEWLHGGRTDEWQALSTYPTAELCLRVVERWETQYRTSKEAEPAFAVCLPDTIHPRRTAHGSTPAVAQPPTRWHLTSDWAGQQVLSVHAGADECDRARRSRTETFRELMRLERAAGHPPPELGSSFMCVPEAAALKMASETHVYVRGEVNEPGAIRHTSGMTLRQALTLSGGLTPLARSTRVLLIQGQGWRSTFNLDDRLLIDPRVQPGDIIVVPQRLF
jgi:hypothetical protein